MRWIPIVAIAVLVVAGVNVVPKLLMRDVDAPSGKRARPRRPVAVSEVCPPADATFEEHPFHLRGRVVDEAGAPVAADVTVVGLESVGPRVRAAKGVFQVELEARDVVRVGIAAEGFGSFVGPRVEVRPGVEADLGVVRLSPGAAIEGTVVDERGTPLPGVRVSLERDEASDPEDAVEQAASTPRWDRAPTDARGAFRFDGLADGTYRLRARAGAPGDRRSVVASGVVAGRRDVRVVVPAGLVSRRYGVKVRVFGPKGDLVEGTRVWIVHPHDTVHSARLRSTMDVEAFDPGPTWLVVRDAVDAKGRVLPWGPVAVRLDPSRTGLDVALPEREGLRGEVLEEDGSPVETVLRAEGRLRQDGSAVPTESDAPVGADWVRVSIPFTSREDGTFEISALPRGRLRLRAEAESSWRIVDPQHVSAGTGSVAIRVRRAAPIAARVEAPEGVRLESTVVRLLRQRSGGDVLETSFTTCGSAPALDLRRSVATDGPYAVEVRATAEDRTLRLGVLRDVRPGAAPPALRLERGVVLEGTVRSAEGEPVPDALVRARRGDGGVEASELPPDLWPRSRADGQGAFVLGGLDAGRWTLVATTRGSNGTLDVDVGSPETPPVVVTVEAGRSVSARIAGDVAGLRVAAFDDEGHPAGATAEPSEDGYVVLHPLPVGRFRLHVWNAEDAEDPRFALTDLVESGTRDLALPLAVGRRVAGRVLSADGAPLEAAAVALRGAGYLRRAVTDETGAFAFNGVPPGDAALEARTADGRSGSARAAADAPVDVVVGR